MKLLFNPDVALSYKSNSQRARVLTESWVAESIYCPCCGHSFLRKHPNNKPAADFYCSECCEQFELKSKRLSMGRKIVDGEYDTMIRRLKSQDNPNFFLLNYSPADNTVLNFCVIPKHFFVPSLIEKRNPLSKTSMRAGWAGCNILLHQIPESGKIYIVKNSVISPKHEVRKLWDRTRFIQDRTELSAKGWLLDVMQCIDKLKLTEFTLEQLYSFQNALSVKHPNNRHVKDKIRQQIQILRDFGYLEFVKRGRYRLTP